MCVYVSVYMCVYVSVDMCVYVSVYMCVYVSVYMCVTCHISHICRTVMHFRALVKSLFI